MNYLKEINAFYDRLEQSPLSASAIALWHALMHVNNKTRWKNVFTAVGAVLRFKAGLTESSFKRARTELKENGYINYQSQTGGRPAIYQMISLVAQWEQGEVSGYIHETEKNECEHFYGMQEFDGNVGHESQQNIEQNWISEMEQDADLQLNNENNVIATHDGYTCKNAFQERYLENAGPHKNQEEDAVMTEGANQCEPRMAQGVDQDMTHDMNRDTNRDPDRDAAPLYKQYINKNKTIQNKTKTSAADNARGGIFAESKNEQLKRDAIVFYRKNFGLVGPFVAESLLDWINDLGEELVIKAMKQALKQNKTSLGYVNSILNSWYKKGIRTLGQAEAERLACKNIQQTGTDGAPFRKDAVPDWFYEQRQKRQKQQENEKRSEQTEAELQAKLRELKKALKIRENERNETAWVRVSC